MNHQAPIVVGGVGGSGTRVVTQLLASAGVFVGTDLNRALDNLWFTLLFKRPGWLANNESTGNGARILQEVGVLEKAMICSRRWTPAELLLIFSAAAEMSRTGQPPGGAGAWTWPFVRAANMCNPKRGRPSKAQPAWGWKEPNTHIFLTYLSEYFPNMRYVLVIRHGLDMAFSNNHAQLYNWGRLFNIDAYEDVPVQVKLLRFWIAANRRAQAVGNQLLGSRFITVNYDELCRNPQPNIRWLLNTLELDTSKSKELAAIPKIPSSSDRYADHDLSVFDPTDLQRVRDLGFSF